MGLFPCSERIYTARARESRYLKAAAAARGGLSDASAAAYHLEQVASFGNACGTIAAVHALTNAQTVGGLAGPVVAFREETRQQSPKERGKSLLTTKHLKQESDSAATHTATQTTCPARD